MPVLGSRHLGDGVYASFDGYQINLAVNHHNNHVVSLDPEVFGALLKFSDEIKEAFAQVTTSDVTEELPQNDPNF